MLAVVEIPFRFFTSRVAFNKKVGGRQVMGFHNYGGEKMVTRLTRLLTVYTFVVISGCAMERSVETYSDNRPCVRNFSSDGSFWSGKGFRTFEDLPKLSKADAMARLATALTSNGYQIRSVDRDLGIISAAQPVVFGRGSTVAFNGAVTVASSGARVQLAFQLYSMAATSADAVQREFCKILAEIGQ
jgi:hypothetical protein